MQMSALFDEKTLDFSKFMVCTHTHRGVELVWTFCRQGGQFSWFGTDIFYGRLLNYNKNFILFSCYEHFI